MDLIIANFLNRCKPVSKRKCYLKMIIDCPKKKRCKDVEEEECEEVPVQKCKSVKVNLPQNYGL